MTPGGCESLTDGFDPRALPMNDLMEMVAARRLTAEEAVDIIMLERELRLTVFQRFIRFIWRFLCA